MFKRDTKEKNQKKAEAKKRKAEQQEQQEQQEPVDDNLAGTTQDGLTACTDLPREAQLSIQQPAQPCLQQQSAQAQLPPASSENEFSHQVDNGLLKDSVVSVTEQNM